ncbi:DUF262 domain-containing protein [Sodaliphilus pleomorphus]|uniref:DUF262 domain-containing protein n=1 Tax=Sodaliphilus pleomorphus TaxID=2606626 RepID=A0A6L5XH06_9BACT|nr:DUF262 domain-containing protein [Sodaliphilus pleomorphus]MSS18763.1 DUF262 domain-containing protein [Sodaliphilus pleomorphus]
MDFIPTTIRGLFDTSIQFVIPVYQRAYSWQIENWKVFLNDLLEQVNRENEYSYGNLLLETIKKDSDYDVIDGQQRLTTLIIFMRSLYNVLEEKDADEEHLADVEEFFEKKKRKRLRPVDNDRACFDSIIIENKTYPVTSNSQKCINDAKDYFFKELSKVDLDTLIQIKDIILDSKVNRLELQGKKEAALMFELQNNRGKDLTNMEKLKSYFMYQMYVNSPAEETDANVENISNYFKEIYKTVYDIKGIDEDSILNYHCFAYLTASFNYRNLDDIKKELASSDNKIEWINNFSRELATTFSNLKTLQTNNSEYYKKLYKVRGKESLPAFIYPFIIKGYKYLYNDSVSLDKLFHILEILAFRYHLMSSRAEINSRLTDSLRSFHGDVESLKTSIQKKLNDSWYWGDNRTKEVLSGWMYENPVLHYILWEYEEYIQGKGYKIGNIEIENEQIEHISPQNPTNGDPIETGYDVDDNNNYSEEFCNKYLNCLGNLMLISGSHNASIGNKPFSDKINSYKENPLLNQQAEIKDFIEDNEVVTWKKSNIEKRLDKILSFALNRWDFNSVN